MRSLIERWVWHSHPTAVIIRPTQSAGSDVRLRVATGVHGGGAATAAGCTCKRAGAMHLSLSLSHDDKKAPAFSGRVARAWSVSIAVGSHALIQSAAEAMSQRTHSNRERTHSIELSSVTRPVARRS